MLSHFYFSLTKVHFIGFSLHLIILLLTTSIFLVASITRSGWGTEDQQTWLFVSLNPDTGGCWHIITHSVWFCLQVRRRRSAMNMSSHFLGVWVPSNVSLTYDKTGARHYIFVLLVKIVVTQEWPPLQHCWSSAKGHLAVTMTKRDIHTCFSLA